MNEIIIRFNYDTDKNDIRDFIENPFDVYLDGQKIDRLKRIQLDFKKYSKDVVYVNYDDFKYNIEQYVDCFNEDKIDTTENSLAESIIQKLPSAINKHLNH